MSDVDTNFAHLYLSLKGVIMNSTTIFFRLFFLLTIFISTSLAGWVANNGLNHNASSKINLKLNKDFSLIYQNNVKGDFIATGNTIMDGDKSTTYFAGSSPVMLNHVPAVSNLGTSDKNKNSSSAPLTLPNYVDVSHIVWAGLFWEGQIDDDAPHTNNVDNQISGWNSVHMQTPDGTIHEITAPLSGNNSDHTTYHYGSFMNGHYRYFYSAYVNITNIIKNSGYTTSNRTFTVGNIMSTDGTDESSQIYFNHINEPTGAWYHLRMGHFAGWSLVVVYDTDLATMNAHPNQIKYRNVSLYNGFDLFSFWTGHAGDRFETTIPISGFKTPRDGAVSSKMLFFGGGGDYGMDFDTLQLEDGNNPGTFVDISNSRNTGTQKFNGTYTNINTDIIPGKDYFQGMDLDIYDTSTLMANDQNTTSIKFGVVQQTGYIDQVFPQTIAFSTELYRPRVCYDYVTKRNEFIIPYTDKTSYESRAEKDDEISITLAIWDIKGDIDPRKVSLGLDLTSQQKGHISPIFSPDKAFYSLKNSNTLLFTNYASPLSTNNRPVITIGKGRSDNIGGTISPDERYFSKFFFKVTNTDGNGFIKGDYNVDVNATFNYGSGDFWQILDVVRCPQDPTYTPTWYQFNVEKVFTTIPSDPTAHYSLPTRIAGKDFNYAVASYTQDANNLYTLPTAANGTTIDVELIDIGAFDDNGSVFKCGNPDPSIITMPGNFVYFQNGSTRENITVNNDLTNTRALRNSTFRMWLLVDENGTIVTDPSFHDKNANAYFSQVYTDTFKTEDVNNLCLSACTSPYNYTDSRGASGCYACLRDFFAQPYCARDNFAIRPKAIEVTLNDRGEDANGTAIQRAKNNTATPTKIAAEYPYQIDLTAVKDNDLKASGYYSDYFKESLHLTSAPTYADSEALHKFEDASACADKEHKTLEMTFTAGLSVATLDGTNVGKYSFEVWDNNWTLVDRAKDNEHKTLFANGCKNSSDPKCNDCLIENPTDEENSNEKTGCVFGSKLTQIDGSTEKNTYTKLNLVYEPYRFDLSSITFHTRPDDADSYLYMNNLNTDSRMAAKLEGNITAEGFKGTPLSNFISTCVATNVKLWLDRTMLPSETNITSVVNGTQVVFEQGLKDNLGLMNILDNSSSTDINSTLTASNFKNTSDTNGSATVDLYFNFAKPYNDTINPIDVNFTILHAASPSASSNANSITNYVPDGNATFNQTRRFFFARLLTINADNADIYTLDFNTRVIVQAYCDNNSIINCALDNDLTAEDANWFRLNGHTTAKGLGGITNIASGDANVKLTFGLQVKVNPLLAIQFDANGSTPEITIGYPLNAGRPAHPEIIITPDPWLLYSTKLTAAGLAGLPSFTPNFLTNGLRWKGVGKTGNVVSTEPSAAQSNRMSW